MTKGLLMVFTGDGKGKTTAALGMAMRSAGHGHNVCFIQYIKGRRRTGEREAARRFPDAIDFHVTGRGFTWNPKDIEEDKSAALAGWKMA